MCLPVLQLTLRFGLSTSGVGVAAVISSSQRLPGRWCIWSPSSQRLPGRWRTLSPSPSQRLPSRMQVDAELSTAATWSLVDGC